MAVEVVFVQRETRRSGTYFELVDHEKHSGTPEYPDIHDIANLDTKDTWIHMNYICQRICIKKLRRHFLYPDAPPRFKKRRNQKRNMIPNLRNDVWFWNANCTSWGDNILPPTVDERNPAPPGMYKTLVNNGINYQPQLVGLISEPSTVPRHPNTSWECVLVGFAGSEYLLMRLDG